MSTEPTAQPTPVQPHEQIEGSTLEIAASQRMVLIAVLVSLVSNGLLRSDALPVPLLLVVTVALVAFMMWAVYRLCRALSVTPWIWMLSTLIPLINLLCLALLSQRATTHLKAHGIKVGLLGAKL